MIQQKPGMRVESQSGLTTSGETLVVRGSQQLWQSMLPYVRIARPDHWFKNIFVLPGFAFAVHDSPAPMQWSVLPAALLGLLATCLVASSNYVLNEILDAERDRLHPSKRDRPVPSGLVNIPTAYVEWLLLGALGLALGWWVNPFVFMLLALLLVMGLLYNVPPLRLKDLPFLDVLTESVNNPIRLCLGWYVLVQAYPPTLSLIMAFWMLGAFFMATKRLAEYKQIGEAGAAAAYRKSFVYYTVYRLILSAVYYASAFSLFWGIFLIRYRIELILSVPFLAGFIPIYLRLGFWLDSPAQNPEKLYRQRGLVLYTAICLSVITLLMFVDMPFLDRLFPLHGSLR